MRFANQDGIGPVNSFEERLKVLRWVRFPRENGMSPYKLVSYRFRKASFVCLPTQERVPLLKLYLKGLEK